MAKIILIGPSGMGKTTLANFLSDEGLEQPKETNKPAAPTAGARILELEAGGRRLELWDCSGDRKYAACWPAITQGATGAVMVYDPEEEEHVDELKFWYRQHLKAAGVKESDCIVLAMRSGSGKPKSKFLQSFEHEWVSLSDDPGRVREVFNQFAVK